MKRLLSILFLIALCAACQKNHLQRTVKPRVVTSIPPYVYLVKEIVGDTMVVSCALGANFNLHTSELTPKQLKTTKGSALFVGVGEAYENRLISAVNQGKNQTTYLQLHKEVPLIDFAESTIFMDACRSEHSHTHHSKDLHIWLAPQSLINQIPVLVRYLGLIAPENEVLYKRNGELLIEKIRI